MYLLSFLKRDVQLAVFCKRQRQDLKGKETGVLREIAADSCCQNMLACGHADAGPTGQVCRAQCQSGHDALV